MAEIILYTEDNYMVLQRQFRYFILGLVEMKYLLFDYRHPLVNKCYSLSQMVKINLIYIIYRAIKISK